MESSSSSGENAFGSDKTRFIMVLTGILLFVIGFLVTLASVHGDQAVASSDGGLSEGTPTGSSAYGGIYLISGISVSLMGVVLATVGPAIGIVRRKV